MQNDRQTLTDSSGTIRLALRNGDAEDSHFYDVPHDNDETLYDIYQRNVDGHKQHTPLFHLKTRNTTSVDTRKHETNKTHTRFVKKL